jgi:hypothetical protein
MKPDNNGHLEATEDGAGSQLTDDQQVISLNTQQAGQQLGVDGRTVRRYIAEGIHRAGGEILYLQARQVRGKNGQEWQIYQTDLEDFQRERNRLSTEGQPSSPLSRSVQESQPLALQIIATELERRSEALALAQEAIERLAREAGRYAGRNEELERECSALRIRVQELVQERDQRHRLGNTLRRIQLVHWHEEES